MTDAPDLLTELAAALPPLLPDGALSVERARSVADRLAGRPGRVDRVVLTAGDAELALARTPAGLRPVVAHVVRGVTLSRRTPDLRTWLDELAGHVARLAADRAGDDLAARRALEALGATVPGPDVEVGPGDVPGGLRTLPARVRGLVPDDVADAVGRTCSSLLQALARNDSGPPGGGPDLARRTAVDYLPTTLRRYLELPVAARDRPLPDGRTAADVLREQVAVLERAAASMAADAHDRAVDALLANGIFLDDRLGGPGLDG